MTLKLKRILISILCVLLCVCGAVALRFNATNSTFNASAEVIEASIADVQDFYRLDDKKAFATSIEVKVDPNDDSSVITVTDGVIVFPNEVVYYISNNEIILNMLGTYTLKYFGEYEGRDIIAQKDFVVIDSLYGLSSTDSSYIDYATEEYLATQTNYQPNTKAAHNITDSKLTHSGQEALTVHLEEGTQFIYSKPIDLRNVGSNGLTDLISFEPRAEDWDYGYIPCTNQDLSLVYDSQGRQLFAQDADKNYTPDNTDSIPLHPETNYLTEYTVQIGKYLYAPMIDENEDGVFDVPLCQGYFANKAVARNLVITLTDCYDSTKYIKMIVSTPQSTTTAALTYTPYVKACTDNLTQDYGLWSIAASESHIQKYPTTGSTNVKGTPNKVLYYPEGRRIAWTTQLDTVWHYGGSFGGYAYNKETYNWMNLKYDYANSTIYANSTETNGAETLPVSFTDFFNEELYPASLGGFRGFTTGEVYISIGFEKYMVAGETARVDIFSIGGESVSNLFAQEGFDPEKGPSQHKYQDDIVPNIDVDFVPTISDGVYVAVGNMFTIPSAKAHDINLVGDVSVNVYRNYASAYQLDVPVVNGKFRVDQKDIYTIVYRARDKMGNVGTKIIKVFGTKDIQNTILLDHNTAQFANIKAGYENTFIAPSSITSLNLADQVKLKIEIVSDFESLVIADLYGMDAIEAFVEADTKYMLKYAGNYKINYYLADNAYNNYDNPISYEFTVSASDKVIIDAEPFMYRHYIKDAYYDFDKIVAYGFSTGKPAVAGDAELWISFDSGAYVKQDSVYGVNITGSQTVQAKYVYGDAVVESAVYPIVDVDYSDAISAKKVSFGNYFVGDFTLPDKKLDGSNNADLYYISNKASGNNVLQFAKPINISEFAIAYRIDANCSNFTGIRFTLTDVNDPSIKVSIYKYKEGDKFYVKFNQDSPKVLEDTFIGGDKSFAFTYDAQIIKVSNLTEYISTDVKFTTNDAYLDIELVNITGDAGITLKSLNAYSLKKAYYDRNTPKFAGAIPSGTFAIGDIITISPALFTDDTSILSKANTSFTVKLGDEFISDVNGVLLDGSQDPTRSYDIRVTQNGRYAVQYSAIDNFNNKLSPTFYFSVKDTIAPEIVFSGSIKEDVIVYAKPGYNVKLSFTMTDNLTPAEALKFKIFIFNTHTASMYAVSTKSFKLNYEGTYDISVVCYDADDNMTIKTFTVVISNEEVK